MNTNIVPISTEVSRATPTPRASGAIATDTPKSSREFQVMMIGQFLQPMLDDTGKALFGENVAGDLYKTQFSNALAEIVVSRGGLGLSDISKSSK